MTDTALKVEPPTYQLCVRKLGAKYDKHKPIFHPEQIVVDPERAASLPIEPKGFQKVTGTWRAVAAEADRLNALQTQSDFLDYFYFPEAMPVDFDRTHCRMCMRIAIREASED